VTRLTHSLTGSSLKTPAQWEAAVGNKTETTERIRLHIEQTEMSVGFCHDTTLMSILPHMEHVGLTTSFLKVMAVSESEKGSKLGGRPGFKGLESKQM